MWLKHVIGAHMNRESRSPKSDNGVAAGWLASGEFGPFEHQLLQRENPRPNNSAICRMKKVQKILMIWFMGIERLEFYNISAEARWIKLVGLCE